MIVSFFMANKNGKIYAFVEEKLSDLFPPFNKHFNLLSLSAKQRI